MEIYEDTEELEEDDFDEELEEEEESSLEDYYDYSFAMEVVNGEIISLTEDLQQELFKKVLSTTGLTEEELANYLVACSEDAEPEDEKYELLSNYDYDMLGEIFGFDFEERTFEPVSFGFLDCGYGWETKKLLEDVGYFVEDNIDYGPHGHGTCGVYFIE